MKNENENFHSHFLASFYFTCSIVEAGLMQDAGEKLQTNDCINEYHKEDKECYVEEGDHGHDNTVEHNL